MHGDLLIRRYRPGDEDRIETVMERAHRDAGAWFGDELDDDFETIGGEYFPDGEFLVGVLDGEVVATIAYRPPGDLLRDLLTDLHDGVAQVERFNVLPAHQCQGYGTRLYDHLERRALADGYEEFVLHTTHLQTAAQHFYRTNGFREVERIQVEEFSHPFELVCYRKAIDDASPFEPYESVFE